MASDATWWASLVMDAVKYSGSSQDSRNAQRVEDGDSAWSTSLRATDSKGPSSTSMTIPNQTETVKTDDKKKKKRRGKPKKKLTGNQREKRRCEIQANGVGPDDSKPDDGDAHPYHLPQNNYSFDALQAYCFGINIKL